MVTTTPDRPATDDVVHDPSVLIVLVVRDGVMWLRGCLQSLAAQQYPRVGVVAVDCASTDGSAELLTQALGEGRVLSLPEDQGIAGALRAASDLPAFQGADYLLILHDDAALAPDAVTRMVEAAEGIHGVELVGVVGPKVVDWDDPRVLREIGRSTDAFGHPFNPLQEGERDQGQHDRVLEVLYVSSCAMLVSREAWQRTGRFDERYGGHHDDLDFCWRARLAGYRVLMTPLAGARHRDAGPRGERPDRHRPRSTRYYAERSGLASMLKDYSIVTLLWTLPLYAVVGLVRLLFLLLARRFEDAYDLGAAWGWNVVHLFGTIRRRVRAQSVRRVRDRNVRRFMASPFRLPRWFERAEEILDEQLEEGEEERPRLRERAVSLAVAHPVLVASFLAIGVGALAVRHFVGPDVLTGGALASFPARPGDFFNELVSATRGTVLGGVQPASPALAGLGGLSWLTFGGTTLAQKVLLAALPPVAAVVLYRALARQTAQPAAAVVGAAAYTLSALMLWGFSEGRSSFLVAVAALPAVWDRLDIAFAAEGPERSGRAIVGLGVAVAVSYAFLPGSALAIALVLAVLVLAGRRRGRGLVLAVSGAIVAAALVFPSLPDVTRAPDAALSSRIGTIDVWSLLRLAPGGGPGTWALAAFLPVAAALCFAVVGRDLRGRAWRSAILAIAGVSLAWASSARYLPEPLTNAPVYLTAAALGMASIVAFGLATLGTRMGQEEFGYRQIAAAVLAIVVAVGFGAQVIQVALAEWAVGPNGLPPAWPIVAASSPGEFRILWLGNVGGDPFPAPGGDPRGVVEAGPASVRYGLTDRDGITALDTGRGAHGPGYDEIHAVLQELLSGSTSHVGQLLAPLGVRFLLAAEGDLPPAARGRLDAQIDLDVVPAGGLVIFENPRAMPVASVVHSKAFARAAGGSDPLRIAALPDVPTTPLERVDGGWDGATQESGYAYVATQFAGGWRAENDGLRAETQDAFGWALGADVRPGAVSFTYARQWVRTAEMTVLALLWVAALWITRKPVST
jgi:GT2 family glycosyltransferase